MGGSTIPGEYILPGLIGKFKAEYPHLTVKLQIADSRDIEARVLAGKLEIGVIGSKSTHPGILSRQLWEDELVLAVPARHPWAQRKAVSLQELAATPFILREEGSGTLKILESQLRAAGESGSRSFRVAARFGSSTAVKEGIKAGFGLSILSARAIHTELHAGFLKALKIKGISLVRNFNLIRNKLRTPSPAGRAMLDYLLATAESK